MADLAVDPVSLQITDYRNGYMEGYFLPGDPMYGYYTDSEYGKQPYGDHDDPVVTASRFYATETGGMSGWVIGNVYTGEYSEPYPNKAWAKAIMHEFAD